MARPLRIEFKGALYHILSRGNERRDIFSDDDDCQAFLSVLKEMSERFEVDILPMFSCATLSPADSNESAQFVQKHAVGRYDLHPSV